MISYRQRQELAAIERELSAEPTLVALTELFAESPPGVSSRKSIQPHTRPHATPARPRIRLVTWIATVAAMLGLGAAIVAGMFRITTVAAIGVTVVVSAILVMAVHLSGPTQSPDQLQHPFIRP